MQIHLANCNLTHPPLQHLPVDESPRGEEMKSVNILQCCHTMFAESAKERRNAFCQYPHTLQYNLIQEIVGPRNANQPSKRRMRKRIPKCKLSKTIQHLCNPALSSCNNKYLISRPKSPVCQWMGDLTCLRVVKSFICVKILV